MEIQQIAIVGSGVMGRGIAQVAATAGYPVKLIDIAPEPLQKAVEDITWSLNKLKQKGKIEGEPTEILGRIVTGTELESALECDFVIEAVPENLDLKNKILTTLDKICGEQTIFASNTSAIPITVLACATNRRDRVVGTHYFNPVPMMKMVEIIRGQETSQQTVDKVRKFVESIGKKYCEVKKDVAGFVMNRIGICSSIEAIRILEEGVATAEEIDQGMRLAYGWPMGPIETFDMTGLDVALGAAWAIYEESKDPKFLPPVLLQRLVAAGNLGRKTGKGFYDYTKK